MNFSSARVITVEHCNVLLQTTHCLLSTALVILFTTKLPDFQQQIEQNGHNTRSLCHDGVYNSNDNNQIMTRQFITHHNKDKRLQECCHYLVHAMNENSATSSCQRSDQANPLGLRVFNHLHPPLPFIIITDKVEG